MVVTVMALEPDCLDLNLGSISQLLSIIMAKTLNFLHLSFLLCKVRIINTFLMAIPSIECVNTHIAPNKY